MVYSNHALPARGLGSRPAWGLRDPRRQVKGGTRTWGNLNGPKRLYGRFNDPSRLKGLLGKMGMTGGHPQNTVFGVRGQNHSKHSANYQQGMAIRCA